MAAVSYTLNLQDFPQVQTVFQAVADRLSDTEPLMWIFAAYGEESSRQRFVDQVDPDGQPWKQSHRARVNGGPTLIDSGHLEASLTHDATADEAVWGVSSYDNVEDYAAIHQFGGIIKAVNAKALRFQLPGVGFLTVEQVVMPQRAYLGVNATDAEEMTRRGLEYLADPIGGVQ